MNSTGNIISFVTPTYNRAHLLPRLYDSLVAQTDKNFEWVVVDDGSTDETESLISAWIRADGSFPIVYYKRENGGKQRALNDGFRIATTEYAGIIDSDDWLTADAVGKIRIWLDEIKEDRRFAGVAGMHGFDEMTPRSGFPKGKGVVDASDIERDTKGLRGDKQEMYRRDLWLAHPFPSFEGEKFVFEAPVYWQIANDGYIVRFHEDIIKIGAYLGDGYTKNMEDLLLNNIKGYTWFAKESFKYRRFPMNYYAVGSWVRMLKRKNISLRECSELIGMSYAVLFVAAFLSGVLSLVKKFLIHEAHERTPAQTVETEDMG
jgi:glycosyltransferase involved in cell wall biosynthesis